MVGTVSNSSTANFRVTPESASAPGYDINPCNGLLFPWLSSIAINFEKYRFNRLSFELVSSQATSAAGRVYMAIDPDWNDPVPTTKSVMMSLECAVDSSVWTPARLDAPISKLNLDMPWRFCSANSRGVMAGEPRTSYAGYLVVATDIPTTANCVWDLWVEYEVLLIEPTAESQNLALLQTTTETPTIGASYWSPLLPFGTSGPIAVMSAALAGLPATFHGKPADAIRSVIRLPTVLSGAINFATDGVITGLKPSQVLSTNGVFSDFEVYNGNGTWLGDLANVNAAVRSFGTNDSSDPVGGQYRTQVTGYLSAIGAQFPTARYLVPYVAAVVSAVFASQTGYLRCEL